MKAKRIVDVSGGAASAVVLLRVIDRHGTDGLVARFADVGSEAPDVYRFLDDLQCVAGVEIVRLTSSRNTWELFESRGMWTSNHGCVASFHLKKIPLRKHAESIGSPAESTIYVGFSPDEQDRMSRLQKSGAPWKFEFPLTWPTPLLRCDQIAFLNRRGITPPDMYERGYPHANCGGACVLAGVGQWRGLIADYPDRFAVAEQHEQKMMAMMASTGRKVSTILQYTERGERKNLSLRELRESVEAGRPPDRAWRATKCSCVGDLWDADWDAKT